jgi:dTDP-glucose 4,6-dehydratase
MSKWLVIGASSFTGKHFCEYLRGNGNKVEEKSLRFWYPETDHDYVVNFAALNVVAPSWEYPIEYMKVNTSFVPQMARYLQPIKRFKRYIHISTPEVYGSTSGLVKENHPFNPSTPYAVSRAAAEMMLNCYHKQYGFPVMFTRSCNVYGPGQQLYRLIPKLIACIKSGVKFPLEGNGHSVRSFLHVSDVCSAIYRVANQGTVGEAYNITSPLSCSITGLVQIVCDLMGKRPEDVIESSPERPGKDAAYRLDDTKIRRLGWNDEMDLVPGIKSVVNWMDKNWDTLKDQSLEYAHRP